MLFIYIVFVNFIILSFPTILYINVYSIYFRINTISGYDLLLSHFHAQHIGPFILNVNKLHYENKMKYIG